MPNKELMRSATVYEVLSAFGGVFTVLVQLISPLFALIATLCCFGFIAIIRR